MCRFTVVLVFLLPWTSIVAQTDSDESDIEASSSQISSFSPSTISRGAAGEITSDAEFEPGLQGSAPGSSPSGDQQLHGGSMDRQLERILEKITSIEGLQVQTLRRIEGLDYRLTRVEVQVQERGEMVRSSAAEALRRFQTLESDVNRIGTLLEVVRDDSTYLRGVQTEIKSILLSALPNSRGRFTSDSGPRDVEPPGPRLQVLLAGVNNLRSMTNGIREDIGIIHTNITLLANLTRSLEKRTWDLVTKQDLLRSFTGNGQSQPARSLATPHLTLTPPTERPSYPRDCQEAYDLGNRNSGIQLIQPDFSSAPFFAQCEMDIRGGGWIVIQNRFDGTVNFLRDWNDYKNGFGNLAAEFWLGLEKIHMITNQGVYELLIELTDFDLSVAWAHYNAFAIGTEIEGYDLRLLGTFEGDAGNSLAYHISMKFSTMDMDQDQWSEGSCAREHMGGWWYRSCDTSNLNGQYLNGNLPPQFEYRGMYWYDYRGPLYSLMKTKMMIRPLPNPSGATPAKTRQTKNSGAQKSKKKKDSE